MKLTQYKLGDFCRMKYGKMPPKDVLSETGYPVFSGYRVTGFAKEYLYDEPRVIVVARGVGGTGDVKLSPEKSWITNLVIVLDHDPHIVDRRFLLYRLGREPLKDKLNTGAAQAQITIDSLQSYLLPLPDLSTQRRIASILSTYDDLIENNRRRIQLLEQAARLLYQEWFVHLRFPGHEHVPVTDGVPEGWEKVPVSSFCTVGRGGSPRPIERFLEGTVPWYKIGDATASESPFVFSTGESIIEDGVRKSVFLPPQELILSNSATCGIPYFTGIPGCIHDGWLYFKDLRRVSKWFFYCCLYEKQRQILMGIGEGATQKNLNTDYIGRQVILLPRAQGVLIAFSDAAEPLFSQIFVLAQANIRLRNARDLLLPCLMNGEIPV